jgi:pantoate--beta-alanine ligase
MSNRQRLLVVETVKGLRAAVRGWKRDGLTVAMVPTMGALHEGHVALMEKALAVADRCLVSIFVNPTQFAPSEDLDKYPRQLARDLECLERAGVQLAYTPTVGEMYPRGFDSRIVVGGPSAGLETDFRPHFFEGVATVVGKLFIQAEPDRAIFGEKDYQQLCVVTKLCADLDLPVEIVGVPTVRDAHGLALSSRNAYLDATQLGVARRLNVILAETAQALRAGTPEQQALRKAGGDILDAGFRALDYVAVREASTLAPWTPARPGRLLAAAWLGQTRLIDNLPV